MLAAALSILWPGLGDAYNGFPGKGWELVAIRLGSVIAAAVLPVVTGLRWTVLAMFLLGLLTGPYGAVRAWREARRLHDVPSPGGRLRRCLVFFVATMVASLVTRTITVEAFKMPSGSMAPNLQLGDHFLVNKFVYGPRLEVPFAQTALMQLPGLREPSVGDVIVFIWPKERDKDFIKRIVAVAGQTVESHGTSLTIDGVVVDEPYAHYVKPKHIDFGPYEVPKGHVFVMGDNRDESYDSRFWGAVPIRDIKGPAILIYWSWAGDGSVRWDRIGRTID